MEKAATILNSSSLAELLIASPAHASSAVDAALDFGQRAWFNREECDEVALAVMELASNLVRHAGGGQLRFNSLDDGERVCRSTRGVVMPLARFDLARQRVELASLGNVESRLLWRSGVYHPVGRRGIVGAANVPSPLIAEHAWKPGFILVLHSDGIEASWQTEQLMKITTQGTAAAARHLLFHHGRLDDDATALVARNAPTPPGREVHPPG